MTNEFVFGYTVIKFPNVFEDPTKIDRTNCWLSLQGPLENGVAQMPSFTGWGGEMATVLNPGGFEVGGSRGLFADKWLPSFSDSMTKVWGTHTTKFGGFYEYIINSQPANGNTNGKPCIRQRGTGTRPEAAYGDMLARSRRLIQRDRATTV